MPSQNEQQSVLNEEVYQLLHPEPPPGEKNRLVAVFCAVCAARLEEERPVERVDTGLWCARCQERIETGASQRRPGFLYGEDEEWYLFYRFCPRCGVELLPRPHRWGVTSGSKVFCRECYTDRPIWLATQQEIEATRSRALFNLFWSDCQNGHLHTMPLWQRLYGLQLYPKAYRADDAGVPSTVTALVLPPKTILGLFLPVGEHPGELYRLGWWSPFERPLQEEEE